MFLWVKDGLVEGSGPCCQEMCMMLRSRVITTQAPEEDPFNLTLMIHTPHGEKRVSRCPWCNQEVVPHHPAAAPN